MIRPSLNPQIRTEIQGGLSIPNVSMISSLYTHQTQSIADSPMQTWQFNLYKATHLTLSKSISYGGKNFQFTSSKS